MGEDACEYSSSRSEFTGSIKKCRMLFLFTSNCAVYRDNRITRSISSFITLCTCSEPFNQREKKKLMKSFSAVVKQEESTLNLGHIVAYQ